MVAAAAATIYRVVTVKRGAITFVAVDGGMGDNLEVALFDQRFEAGDRRPARRGRTARRSRVVGRHCESGDVLVDGVPLAAPRVGDLLAVPATGAYCFTMANNYNGNRRIPVVFAGDGAAAARRAARDLGRPARARRRLSSDEGETMAASRPVGRRPRCGSRSCGASRSPRWRRRPGADSGRRRAARSIGLFQLSMFGVGATIGTGIFIVLTQAVPVAGPAVIWSFVHRRHGRRADGHLLRRAGQRRAGLGLVVLLRLRDARARASAMVVAACLLLEYGVSGGRGRRRLVAVPQRAAGQPVRLHDPRGAVAGAGAGRHHQPARRRS